MAKDYTFIQYYYDAHLEPCLSLLPDDKNGCITLHPRDTPLTLAFDTTTRFCCGWHDLATSESFACPDRATTLKEYNQCMHCQRKTGFNPAFYNAASVSPQQQVRNSQPHFLYIAHFAPGVVKVGISWSNRGIRRLLDQGARSYLIIKDYPNATIARQYEAKIAALPGIVESLQGKTKYMLLTRPYDVPAAAEELIAVRDRIKNELNIEPDDNQPEHPHELYVARNTFEPHKLIQLDNNSISGRCLGMIGSVLLTEHNDTPYFLSLSKLTGYRVTVDDTLQENQHKPQQVSLF